MRAAFTTWFITLERKNGLTMITFTVSIFLTQKFQKMFPYLWVDMVMLLTDNAITKTALTYLMMAGPALQVKLILLGLALATLLVASLNFMHYANTQQLRDEIEHLNKELRQARDQAQRSSSGSSSVESKTKPSHHALQYQTKANSINSFWWPSPQQGGLLAKIHLLQNPADCNSPSTRYFVWRSLNKRRDDHRGLSAWGHTAMWQLLHGNILMKFFRVFM